MASDPHLLTYYHTNSHNGVPVDRKRAQSAVTYVTSVRGIFPRGVGRCHQSKGDCR